MILRKKGMGAVIAIALLVTLSVVAVIGFQSWYGSYSSEIFSSTESNNKDLTNNVGIEVVVGNQLYVKSDDNISIKQVLVDGQDCGILLNFSGVENISLQDCLDNAQSITPEITIVTNDKVISKKVYLPNVNVNSLSKQGFYLGSNSVTVFCPNANIGDIGEVNGINYTKRTVDQINSTNAESTCTSGITNMSSLFLWDSSFNQNISSWDTSSVIDMNLMFRDASSFNGDISNWDTSSVRYMNQMFRSASSFNGDINNWDVSSVTDMGNMFYLATKFNQSLSNWDVSNVNNMASMFCRSDSFNQNLNSWNTSKVTSMSWMFRDNAVFNGNINNWNTSLVIYMYGMFQGASSFNQDLSSWNVDQVTFCTDFNTSTTAWTLDKPNFTSCSIS